MTRKLLGALMAGWIVAVAGGSGAATLPFEATLGITLAGLEPVGLVGSGVATINSSGGGVSISSLHLPAGAVGGTASIQLGAAPISGLVLAGGTSAVMIHLSNPASFTISQNAPFGSLSNASGSFGGGPFLNGIMPLNGVAIVCLFQACNGQPAANLVVPLSPVGQGGSAVAQGLVSITVVGAPWTTGMVSIENSASTGFAHGPASGASAAMPGGVLSLVTPVTVSTSLGVFPVVPVFARLTLHFVPEPGTLVLVCSGLVGFAIAGRRRMSK